MHVEACCKALLAHCLPAVDPERKGMCLDVGVGTFAFYCEQFARLGFPTVAVEPLPTTKLRRLCQKNSIPLIESCLSDINGDRSLYLGTFAGLFNRNFSSLSPDWFGSSKTARQVPSMRLSALLTQLQAQTLTCLKLDIEGWESTIIEQFVELPETLLPKIVMFEYGGGVSRKQAKRGWSPKFLKATLDCLSVLKQCGYSFSIAIDYTPTDRERIFNLQSSSLEADTLFHEKAVYGNIISFSNWDGSPEEVARVCAPYYGGWENTLVTALLSMSR
ncbi:MAG: FkbM family methyltransferase [Microcoleus sp. SM1_3_4]|nr:FkbM family methyltransferase [Microcoleus sp. SM1_3_4]